MTMQGYLLGFSGEGGEVPIATCLGCMFTRSSAHYWSPSPNVEFWCPGK